MSLPPFYFANILSTVSKLQLNTHSYNKLLKSLKLCYNKCNKIQLGMISYILNIIYNYFNFCITI